MFDWLGNTIKNTANWIDNAVYDIPFVSNPFAQRGGSAPKPNPPNPPKPTPQTPAPTSYDSSYISSLNNQLAALQRQLAYQPKLPVFDVMGNYNRARSQAEAAVNPLYDKYLRDFLAGQQVQRTNKQQQTDLTKESTALELQQALAGNDVQRTRTAQDVASAIEKIGEQEQMFQEDTGTQFDTDRRALAEDVAARGLTTSGLGRGQIYDQNNKRNLDEGRQVKEYNNQREAKKLFQARTFEDLARGDDDSRNIAAQKDKQANFDLEAYLEELAVDETQFRNENEYKRLSDVGSQTQSYERAGTQSFLSSLAGAGWRPQDIAFAYQVYG